MYNVMMTILKNNVLNTGNLPKKQILGTLVTPKKKDNYVMR